MTTTATQLTDHLAQSRATDYFFLREQLTAEQLDALRRVRAFVDEDVLPVIAGYWERAEVPWPLIRRIGELGIVGEDIDGYGCPGFSAIACGLVHMELNRGDGSLGTFLGVHAGLAMKAIAMLGSDEQKQRWLPAMARLEQLGAFALTEPNHGSDSVALETTARRDGDHFVIDGAKRWIGLGSLADVVVVWARGEDGAMHGYLVEKGTAGRLAQTSQRDDCRPNARSAVGTPGSTFTVCHLIGSHSWAEQRALRSRSARKSLPQFMIATVAKGGVPRPPRWLDPMTQPRG
jgi:glutaryl-CoA dehydrogenase